MNGKFLTRRRATSSLLALPGFALGVAALLLSGCVTYRAHVRVLPDGALHIRERAELLPGVKDTLRLDPKLSWTAFQAAVQTRGGQFAKDTSDSLRSAEGEYELEDWSEFGQRGQAFKGIDEIEKRTRPANAQTEVKDQYFYRDTELTYKVELSEPSGVEPDSVALPFLEAATGVLEIEVPGTVLESNAKDPKAKVLSWDLRYGQAVDARVKYRTYEWVAMVSVVLVAIFLVYVLIESFKALRRRKQARS
jgi:hypothetical protein